MAATHLKNLGLGRDHVYHCVASPLYLTTVRKHLFPDETSFISCWTCGRRLLSNSKPLSHISCDLQAKTTAASFTCCCSSPYFTSAKQRRLCHALLSSHTLGQCCRISWVTTATLIRVEQCFQLVKGLNSRQATTKPCCWNRWNRWFSIFLWKTLNLDGSICSCKTCIYCILQHCWYLLKHVAT